jgi:hypothetical protein
MKIRVDVENNNINQYGNILKSSYKWKKLKRDIILKSFIDNPTYHEFVINISVKKSLIYVLYSSFELRKYIGIGVGSIPSLFENKCAYIKKMYFKLFGVNVVELWVDIIFLDSHYGTITQKYLKKKTLIIKQCISKNSVMHFIIVD